MVARSIVRSGNSLQTLPDVALVVAITETWVEVQQDKTARKCWKSKGLVVV